MMSNVYLIIFGVLPKLTDCRWNIQIGYAHEFLRPDFISTSIKRLSIPKAHCNLSQLIRLCEYTPNLEYLSIIFHDYSDQLQLPSSFRFDYSTKSLFLWYYQYFRTSLSFYAEFILFKIGIRIYSY